VNSIRTVALSNNLCHLCDRNVAHISRVSGRCGVTHHDLRGFILQNHCERSHGLYSPNPPSATFNFLFKYGLFRFHL
jgi:hypothetical protein